MTTDPFHISLPWVTDMRHVSQLQISMTPAGSARLSSLGRYGISRPAGDMWHLSSVDGHMIAALEADHHGLLVEGTNQWLALFSALLLGYHSASTSMLWWQRQSFEPDVVCIGRPDAYALLGATEVVDVAAKFTRRHLTVDDGGLGELAEIVNGGDDSLVSCVKMATSELFGYLTVGSLLGEPGSLPVDL